MSAKYQKPFPSNSISKHFELINEIKDMLKNGRDNNNFEFVNEGGRSIIFSVDDKGKQWVILQRCRHDTFHMDMGGAFSKEDFSLANKYADYMAIFLQNTLRELNEETGGTVSIAPDIAKKCTTVINIDGQSCRRDYGYGLFVYVDWDTFETIVKLSKENMHIINMKYEEVCEKHNVNIDELTTIDEAVWQEFMAINLDGYIEVDRLTVFSLDDIHENCINNVKNRIRTYLTYDGSIQEIARRPINYIMYYKKEIDHMYANNKPLSHVISSTEYNTFGTLTQINLVDKE